MRFLAALEYHPTNIKLIQRADPLRDCGPPLAEQLYRQTRIEFSNGLKIQMDRANVWGNSLRDRKFDACRFFRECGLLASGEVQTIASVAHRGALAASSCHGFMAAPSGKGNPEVG